MNEFDFLPDDIMIKTREKSTERTWTAKKTVEAIKLVAEHGLEPVRALQIVNGKTNIHPESVRRLKKKVERWSIERPAVQKLAHTTLMKFASGKDVNGIIPKAVDVRACAERIIDQATPITRRTESVNINVDVCPVDLSRYSY